MAEALPRDNGAVSDLEGGVRLLHSDKRDPFRALRSLIPSRLEGMWGIVDGKAGGLADARHIVDLHFRGLVKYRQESQIPPPAWRDPPKQERSHISPQDSPIHIQLPQPVTDTYKLAYISHQARGDSDSGEHSPADSQGVDIHPGPALRKAHSLEYLDVEATGGPELREHSPVKFSGTTLPGPACSLKSSTALKENPAHGGPDSRDCSTAKSFKGVDSRIAHRSTSRVTCKDNPAREGPDSRDRSTAYSSGLTNPSDPTEGDPPKQESDHPPKTLPVPTP